MTRLSNMGLAQRFGRFAIVGGAATGAHYAVLIGVVEILGANPLLATSAGFAVGAVVSYVVNYRLTFGCDLPHTYSAPRFLAGAISGAALNSAMVALLMNRIGAHYLAAQVVATVATLLWNFYVSYTWSFKRQPQ